MSRKGKRSIYFDQAERLYVVDQLSLVDIAERLPISVRTLSTWSREGDWRAKRAKYLEERKTFHEELYEFGRELLRKIKVDLAANKEVSANQLYTLKSLLPQISRVKAYEDLRKQADENQQGDVSEDELLAIIRRELVGDG